MVLCIYMVLRYLEYMYNNWFKIIIYRLFSTYDGDTSLNLGHKSNI